jgi:hypothetical protein
VVVPFLLLSLLHGITLPGSHYFQTLGVLRASKIVTEGYTKLRYVCVVGSHDIPSQHKCSLRIWMSHLTGTETGCSENIHRRGFASNVMCIPSVHKVECSVV